MSSASLFPDPPANQPSGSAETSTLGSTQSLYRKYRPQTFESFDLVGQDAIVRTLRNAIRLDRVAHAYLFTGPRGTGKTSTARLLAKAVNCLDPDPDARPCNRCAACVAINNGSTTDVIEIDAASNRGIDDIRELRERVKFAPTFLKYKFYIVDEAHQITGAAANAFLKTLEEPPSHTKFILATTDPEQLLPTIVSRCQRFDFKRFTQDQIVSHLTRVASSESVPIGEDALKVIAEHAGGSMRDALGILDQLSSYRSQGEDRDRLIESGDVRNLLGIARSERVLGLVTALADADAGKGLDLINAAFDAGEDTRQLNRQLVATLRAVMFQVASGTPGADPEINELARRFSLPEIARHSSRFIDVDYRIRHASLPQLPLEIAFVQATLDADRVRPTPGTTRANQATHPETAPPVRAVPSPTPKPERTIASTPERPESTKGTPRSGAVTKPVESAPPSAAPIVPGSPVASITVDLLHDLWPKIRLDIKARDRRIEALLSSCDPSSVNGTSITLVTNYKFHLEKLNEDASRELVESVIGRLVNQPVSVTTEIRGGNGTTRNASPGAGMADVERVDSAPEPAPPAKSSRTDEEQSLVDAAKKLFDAEEINPSH